MSEDTERTPRWVKVFGAAVILVLVLLVVLVFVGGRHGPGRHAPSATAPSDQRAGAHAP